MSRPSHLHLPRRLHHALLPSSPVLPRALLLQKAARDQAEDQEGTAVEQLASPIACDSISLSNIHLSASPTMPTSLPTCLCPLVSVGRQIKKWATDFLTIFTYYILGSIEISTERIAAMRNVMDICKFRAMISRKHHDLWTTTP